MYCKRCSIFKLINSFIGEVTHQEIEGETWEVSPVLNQITKNTAQGADDKLHEPSLLPPNVCTGRKLDRKFELENKARNPGTLMGEIGASTAKPNAQSRVSFLFLLLFSFLFFL